MSNDKTIIRNNMETSMALLGLAYMLVKKSWVMKQDADEWIQELIFWK